MIYGLPENPTREDVRKEYTLVNMRFRELKDQMKPLDRNRVAQELSYVKDDINQECFAERNSLMLIGVDGILSKYRRETDTDLRLAAGFYHNLISRSRQIQNPQFEKRMVAHHLDWAFLESSNFDPQHPETYTRAIDKALFHLGEAEKLILEAEQKPTAVGV